MTIYMYWWRAVMTIYKITNARRGRDDDSHWPRSLRYTWDTSSDVSRTESSDTPDKTHGSTWLALRPSCSPYMTDMLTGPVTYKAM